MNTEVMFSKKSDDWSTPKDFYDKLNNFFQFDFDPCPLHALENGFDGLSIEWGNSNFVNPPYSNIKEFVNKAIKEHKKGKNVVFLVPSRTDTKWFHKIMDYGAKFFFYNKRLKFGDSNQSAPFPSVVIVFTGLPNEIHYLRKENIYALH